jgi:hypothetical protein
LLTHPGAMYDTSPIAVPSLASRRQARRVSHRQPKITDNTSEETSQTSNGIIPVAAPGSTGKNTQSSPTSEPTHLTTPPATHPSRVPHSTLLAKILMFDLQTNNPEEVADALQFLANSLWNHGGVEDAHRLGAPAIVLATMRKFCFVERIQAHGCVCIQVMSPSDVMLELGGVDWIAHILKMFPHSLMIQGSACGALAGVFVTMRSSQVVHRFVYELCGVQMVVQAMKIYSDSAELQWFGCALLGSLATMSQSVRSALLQNGAGDVIQTAWQTHGSVNSGVAHQASCAWHLLFKNAKTE